MVFLKTFTEFIKSNKCPPMKMKITWFLHRFFICTTQKIWYKLAIVSHECSFLLDGISINGTNVQYVDRTEWLNPYDYELRLYWFNSMYDCLIRFVCARKRERNMCGGVFVFNCALSSTSAVTECELWDVTKNRYDFFFLSAQHLCVCDIFDYFEYTQNCQMSNFFFQLSNWIAYWIPYWIQWEKQRKRERETLYYD